MRLYLWICVLLIPMAAFSTRGPQQKIDSLKQLLPNVPDSSRVVVLRELSYTLANRNPEEAVIYGQRALLQAVAIRNPELRASVQSALALAYRHKGEAVKSLDLNRSALDYYLASNNLIAAAAVHANMSAVYMSIGRYALALESAFDALKIYEEFPPGQPKAFALERIGNIYYEQGKMSRSRQYYERALDLYRKKGSPADVARCLGNMARVFKATENREVALEYLFKAYQIHIKMDDLYSAQINLANIGNVYLEQELFAKAIQYHTRALQMSKADGIRASIAINQGNLGITYFRLYQKNGTPQLLDESIELLKQAVESCRDVQQTVPQIEFGMVLARAQAEKGKHEQAFAILRRFQIANATFS